MLSVDALLLDLDGTLINHEDAAARAVTRWSALVLPGAAAGMDAATVWRALERQHFAEFLAGRTSFVEQRRARVRGFHASLASLSDDDADAAFSAYLDHYRENWSAYPDAAPFLDVVLDTYRVAVLTNGDGEQQREKLRRTGLADDRLPVFASSEVGHAKPAREAYLAACEALGVDPGRTLMLGDDLAADVLGARAAGLAALHLDRSGRTCCVGAVSSLTAAAELILG